MSARWRDMIATVLVAIGVILFGAWALKAPIAAFDAVEVLAIGILVLGVAASISAVVPGFGELLRGSRIYLGLTSLLGVVALVAGVYAVAAGESAALWLLVGATVILWAASTARHFGLLQPLGRQ